MSGRAVGGHAVRAKNRFPIGILQLARGVSRWELLQGPARFPESIFKIRIPEVHGRKLRLGHSRRRRPSRTQACKKKERHQPGSVTFRSSVGVHRLARQSRISEGITERRSAPTFTLGARSAPFGKRLKGQKRRAESCLWIWLSWIKLRFHQSSEKGLAEFEVVL